MHSDKKRLGGDDWWFFLRFSPLVVAFYSSIMFKHLIHAVILFFMMVRNPCGFVPLFFYIIKHILFLGEINAI